VEGENKDGRGEREDEARRAGFALSRKGVMVKRKFERRRIRRPLRRRIRKDDHVGGFLGTRRAGLFL
jgi:RNase P protein component